MEKALPASCLKDVARQVVEVFLQAGERYERRPIMPYSPDQKDVDGIKELEDQAPKVCPNCGKPMKKIVTSREFRSYTTKCPWCKTKFEVKG